MRIFIGTALPSALATDLDAHAAEHFNSGAWKVAAREQWHVTSLFVGERDEVLLSGIEAKVAAIAARHAPVTLWDGRLVTMPKDGPSMLWVRFTPSPGLTALHHDLANVLGTEPSIHRPYWPHITLARRRAGRVDAVEGTVVVERFRLDHITLFRSAPSPQGSVHSPIATWPLSGTAPADR
ncbi:MAG: RNA 2',3'-cyclic phosphodiesterase [Flavobacteriales bacterium]|nr:RNA 2',3'-cyclic phosphodiesterase [Flavobacteriales bacterium]